LRAALPAGVPLATSEPLVGYQRAFVRDFGDFLAPNIHPVFDRSEVPADEAAAWARQQAADLARQVGRPVLLKETGFPHAGQDIYSRETQRAFWRAYLAPGRLATVESAAGNGVWAFHGVAFEAFDLPWKSEESKLPIESAWGLFSPTREPWPALDAWRGKGH
jgi:exo-beta-1,3-glucanase (GH17 family)